MKRTAFLLMALGLLPILSAFADISSVEAWTIDPANNAAHDITIRRGETRIILPTFGTAITGATNVVMKYRGVGTTNVEQIAGTVSNAAAGTVSVRWTTNNEAAAYTYVYNIEVQSSNAVLLRAFGTIALQPAIPSTGTAIPLPAAPISPGDISSIDAWTIRTANSAARNIQIRGGETRILAVTYDQDLTEATSVVLRYRTGTMTNYYTAAGEISNRTGGVVRIKWTPDNEGPAKAYIYEIAVNSTNASQIRAFGEIKIFQSIGRVATAVPTTGVPLNWGAITEHLNLGFAPFPTYIWTTNYVAEYVAAHGAEATSLPYSGLTGNPTNAPGLQDLISASDDVTWRARTNDWNTVTDKYPLASNPSNFCTLAAAALLTNGLASTSYVAQVLGGYLPTNTTLGISASEGTNIASAVTASMLATGNVATATSAGVVTGAQSNIIAAALTDLPVTGPGSWTLAGGLVISNQTAGVSAANVTNDLNLAVSPSLTSTVAKASTAYGWGNHADGGYLTSTPTGYADPDYLGIREKMLLQGAPFAATPSIRWIWDNGMGLAFTNRLVYSQGRFGYYGKDFDGSSDILPFYFVSNFVAGVDYIAPGGDISNTTGLTPAQVAAAGGLTNITASQLALVSSFAPSNWLGNVANGTLTVTRAMTAYGYIEPTNAIVIVPGADWSTNEVGSFALDHFGTSQVTWGAGITNLTVLSTNAWNSRLFYRGYRQPLFIGVNGGQ